MPRFPKKIAVSCGGTGGHIYPGLAVAEELRNRGHEIVLWLAGKDIENVSAGDWDGPVVVIEARGLPSGCKLNAIPALFSLLAASSRCTRLMKADRPDIVLAMGSYASIGPGLAAKRLKIPLVLHEGNAVPGRATSFLARYATSVAVSFEGTVDRLSRAKCVVTGFPVRSSFAASLSRQPPRGTDRFTVLVMGGSQGAHALNETASEAICALHGKGISLRVIHLAGSSDESFVRSRYEEAGVESVVHAFLKDIAHAHAMSDMAVSRAGGSTCAELSVSGLHALLVPFPFAPRDHQTANARAMAASGRADVVQEKDLAVEWLCDYIEKRINMPRAAETAKTGGASAAARIADLVESSVV